MNDVVVPAPPVEKIKVSRELLNLAELIKTRGEKEAKAYTTADNHAIARGLHLTQAKEQCRKEGVNWAAFCEQYCNVRERQADRYIAWAANPEQIKRDREANRIAVAKHAEKERQRRSVLAKTEASKPESTPEPAQKDRTVLVTFTPGSKAERVPESTARKIIGDTEVDRLLGNDIDTAASAEERKREARQLKMPDRYAITIITRSYSTRFAPAQRESNNASSLPMVTATPHIAANPGRSPSRTPRKMRKMQPAC